MAPRQLILPSMEDDLHPEPGSKRVRPSSDEKNSMQVQLRASASACGTPWPGPALDALSTSSSSRQPADSRQGHTPFSTTPPTTTPPQRAGNGGMAASLFVRELPATICDLLLPSTAAIEQLSSRGERGGNLR
eukprot:scaffold32517_cov105-Isochrysis_galbana.AAC.1